MKILVPDSWGSDLREFNPCHNPAGPGGGRFCSTQAPADRAGGGGSSIPGFLRGEASRAKGKGIKFEVAHSLGPINSSYDPVYKKVELGIDTTQPYSLDYQQDYQTKPAILSVARHELGHADYNADQHRFSRYRGGRYGSDPIIGNHYGQMYQEEFGAWKQAIRNSGRVKWATVRRSLDSYLQTDLAAIRQVEEIVSKVPKGVIVGLDGTSVDPQQWSLKFKAEYNKLLDSHVALLKRYARVVRRTRFKRK